MNHDAKALLMKLGLDLAGLNKEEIVQLARQRFDEGPGSAGSSNTAR